MFVAEDEGKHHCHHQRIRRKDKPCLTPSGHLRFRTAEVHKTVHHRLCAQRTHRRTDTVCHDDEQSLCARTDGDIRFPVHKERAGYVEEIERHSIHQHGEDEHPHPAARVSQTEEAETQHPGHHGYQHHPFDAEPAQEERDEQDAAGLTHLRERNQQVGMLYPERIGVFRNGLETRDERVGESVGNLERNAQQHREDEEDSHLPLLEEQESVQAQRLHQRFPGTSLAHRTARQRVGIERQYGWAGKP